MEEPQGNGTFWIGTNEKLVLGSGPMRVTVSPRGTTAFNNCWQILRDPAGRTPSDQNAPLQAAQKRSKVRMQKLGGQLGLCPI